MSEQIEKFNQDVIDDVVYTDGVLTINFANGHIYILNRQTPTHQIWLVSPLSGPDRFDYDASKGQWVSNKVNLLDKLNQEFERIRQSIAPNVSIEKLI